MEESGFTIVPKLVTADLYIPPIIILKRKKSHPDLKIREFLSKIYTFSDIWLKYFQKHNKVFFLLDDNTEKHYMLITELY